MSLSLRQRLAFTHAAVMAVAIVAVGIVEHRWHRQELHDRLDAGLVTIAAAQAASAIDTPTDQPHLHPMHPTRGVPAPKVALIDPQGHPVKGSSLELTTPAMLRRRSGFATVTIGEDNWRIFRQPFQIRRATYTLIVGQDLSPVEIAERGQWYLLGGWLVAGLAASAMLGSWIADLSARPLRDLADMAKRIGPEAITERLPVPDTGDELAVLTESLNRMLTRLEQAFATQRRFVHDAAHEVRTPLAALKTSLEVAIRRPRDAAAYEEAIRDALAEIDRLNDLVNQLLTLERSGMDLRLGPTPLAEVIAQALQRFHDVAAERRVTLRQSGESVVLGDPARLAQVLDNLLSNAIRYSPPGGDILVSSDTQGDTVVLRVSDQGPGIPAEQQNAVFDRFFRIDPSRHHATGGAGLGLAICRAIVEGHGGRIAIEPSPVGTVVRADLPAAAAPAG
jgi:two-component system OmpR family sensor kinase